MAFLVKSNVIISDGRELIGVTTAGITTALYVGSDIQADAVSGIITAASFRGDGSQLTGVGLTNTADYEIRNLIATGVVTATSFVGSGASLTDIPGLSWVATDAPTVRPDGRPLQEGDIYYDSDDLRQYTRFDNAGSPIWVDSNPAANSALDYEVDGSEGQVIPGSDVLKFATDSNVNIGVDTTTDTLTFGLESDVAIAGSMTAGFYYGDGSNLTGVGLGADSDLETTGNIQAGIITATEQLVASGTGIGLTVTNDAFVGGRLFVDELRSDSFVLLNEAGTKPGLQAVADGQTTLFYNGVGKIQTSEEGADVFGYLTVSNNANVTGIATANILSSTGVSGVGLTVTSDAFIGGNVTVVGDLEANDVNTTSDVTKKENISVIEGALAKVAQLRGVTFDWKSTGAHSGGIIAQDVEKVLPTLVKEGDDHKTVIYNGIVGLLVEAVKELVAEVEELKQNK